MKARGDSGRTPRPVRGVLWLLVFAAAVLVAAAIVAQLMVWVMT